MNFLLNPTAQDMILMYIIMQIFSAIVQSLPTPTEINNVWYKSFYNFLSVISTDFKSFVKPPSTIATTSTGGTVSTLRTDSTGEKSLTEATTGPSATVTTIKGA